MFGDPVKCLGVWDSSEVFGDQVKCLGVWGSPEEFVKFSNLRNTESMIVP